MSDMILSGAQLPIPGGMEISVITTGINALVDYAKAREDGKTQRALMMAKKEIELAAIDGKTKIEIANIRRAMENDKEFHAQRMEIIRSIGTLITENATRLTPEMMTGAQFLLQVYQAIGNGE